MSQWEDRIVARVGNDPSQVVRQVGRRISELRKDAQLTQSELAEQAGVGVRYLQRIEAGEINLTIRSLVRFSHLLDTSVIELFREPKAPRPRRGRPRRT